MSESRNRQSSRREFLGTTGRVAAASALSLGAVPAVHAAGSDTIKVVLVGCGGRGTGAVENALSTTSGPTELVAMADVFEPRMARSLEHLSSRFGKQINVPKERQFLGFDAYRKAIDAVEGTGVVVLATPPGFRPPHVEYAVSKGCHVFMEKAMAVDGPGVRRLLKAGQEADRKGLKIAAGLMSRHYNPLVAAVQQVHEGLIGDVITCWAYRQHGPVGLTPKQEGMTEMAHQVRNFHNFNWLGGSFILDWLIHNLDVCCWAKDGWPVSAQGQGARQGRTQADQMFNQYAVEYSFGDGTRMFAQARHMAKCWDFWGCVIHGTKGTALMGEGIPEPRIFKGHKLTDDKVIWKFTGDAGNHYQAEHDLLFDAIRRNQPYNETERAANATLAGILGRMAAESGQEITWEQALNSQLVLAPGIENYTMDTKPPIVPDEQGHYPVAIPGETQVL